MNYEQFHRTRLLFGEDGFDHLRHSHIAVVGCGAVGSFAIEALARAGIGCLTLIDGDNVEITNINRQLCALHSTVGESKTDILKKRIFDICPDTSVYTKNVFITSDNCDSLWDIKPDFVIDAIDTVTGKIELVMKAKEYNVPIISSMGAGNKLDPTKFEVSDIYKTKTCPLAKVMRNELKKRDIKKLKVVYSKEEPIKIKGGNEEVNGENTKKRVPGSVSFVPSVAGLIIAGEVIKDLIKKC